MSSSFGVVAVVGSTQEHRARFCSALAKKSESSGLEMYHRRGLSATLVSPANYPERVTQLCEAATLCSSAVLLLPEQGQLGWQEAESILSLDAAGVKSGLIVGSPGMVDRQLLGRLLAGTSVESFEYVECTPERYTEVRLDNLSPHESSDDPALVSVDNTFNVKGVGLVCLGFVLKGVVRVHDVLATETGKEIEVRSIQVMDVDVEAAYPGQRLGLAVKGATEKELGDKLFLGKDPAFREKVEGEFKKCGYYKGGLEPGPQYSLVIGGQSIACKASFNPPGTVVVEPSKKLPSSVELGILVNPSLKPGSLRIVGSIV